MFISKPSLAGMSTNQHGSYNITTSLHEITSIHRLQLRVADWNKSFEVKKTDHSADMPGLRKLQSRLRTQEECVVDDDEGRVCSKPPPKDDDQSSKKPRESEASASKQHPALTSTGWQITNTREAGVDSSMHRSDPESEHSEQSSDDISMQDEDDQIGGKRTTLTHSKGVDHYVFKAIPESERPATPETRMRPFPE
ncbi:hypothetical protein Tco_1193286 [Tanacetum coccineum]